jgi:hypothetical protein
LLEIDIVLQILLDDRSAREERPQLLPSLLPERATAASVETATVRRRSVLL